MRSINFVKLNFATRGLLDLLPITAERLSRFQLSCERFIVFHVPEARVSHAVTKLCFRPFTMACDVACHSRSTTCNPSCKPPFVTFCAPAAHRGKSHRQQEHRICSGFRGLCLPRSYYATWLAILGKMTVDTHYITKCPLRSECTPA